MGLFNRRNGNQDSPELNEEIVDQETDLVEDEFEDAEYDGADEDYDVEVDEDAEYDGADEDYIDDYDVEVEDAEYDGADEDYDVEDPEVDVEADMIEEDYIESEEDFVGDEEEYFAEEVENMDSDEVYYTREFNPDEVDEAIAYAGASAVVAGADAVVADAEGFDTEAFEEAGFEEVVEGDEFATADLSDTAAMFAGEILYTGEDVAADEYTDGEILYEDTDMYNAEYRGEELGAASYKGETAEEEEEEEKKGLLLFWSKLALMDRILYGTGVAVVLVAIITLFVFLGLNAGKDTAYALGNQIESIQVIGGEGIEAVANARQAKILAREEAERLASLEAEESSTEEYEESEYDRSVAVTVTTTSILEDLKIKFTNSKTGKLIANVPFTITVTDPDGKESIWSDDDMDGIIYKKNIKAGKYTIAMEEFTDEKYSAYAVSTASKTAEVKANISYTKVDVSNEVKSESEINVAKEDTKIKQTQTESVKEDTVAYTDSTAVAETYTEIVKSAIPDPMTLIGTSMTQASSMKFQRIALQTSGTNSAVAATNTANFRLLTAVATATPSVSGNDAVTLKAGKLSASTSNLTLVVGKTGSATVTASEFTADKALNYSASSSNTGVATVSVDGSGNVTVTAVAAGESKITVTADYADKGEATQNTAATAEIAVKVTNSATVNFSTTSTTLYAGYKTTVTAAAANISAPSITTSSSDASVATAAVESPSIANGSANLNVVITALKAGTTNITVTIAENGVETSAVTTVTVLENPRNDNSTPLKDANGNELFVLENGTYRQAYYADYYTFDKFFLKGDVKYTGWQTLNGHTFYFNANGQAVTGTQVIQGVTYNFSQEGYMVSSEGVLGIDVSKWNGNIDWTAVKNSGVNYVIIRCGYRGSSAGSLIKDSKFESNIKGATNAGLKVGVYFFSQAIDQIEAVEEASMVLDLVKNYKISYPIFLDVEASGGRADSLDKASRTSVIKAFCSTIQSAGYTAGVYANKSWLETKINTGELSNFKIWLAQYASTPTYGGRYNMWQYRDTGKVSGISGNVDMNLSYLGY